MAPFFIKNCSIVPVSTGKRAYNLLELRDQIAAVPLECIHYHFWGRRLSCQYTIPEYHNDFALWSNVNLKDPYLYEQFNILDPKEYSSWEILRANLIEIIEDRMDNVPFLPYVDPFYFIQTTLVVFTTIYQIGVPEDLMTLFDTFSLGSVYTHFIDSSFELDNKTNDLIEWLKSFGAKYKPLVEELDSLDVYFFSLAELKNAIFKIIARHL